MSGEVEAVREMLKADAWVLTLAAITTSLGIASLLLAAMNRRAQVRVAVLFGILSVIYGSRLAIDTPTFRFALGLSRYEQNIIVMLLSYVLVIPVGLFWIELLGTTSRPVLRRFLPIVFIAEGFAIVTTLYAVAMRQESILDWGDRTNNILVFSLTVLTIVTLVLDVRNRSIILDTPNRVWLTGMGVMSLAVLYRNGAKYAGLPELQVETPAFAVFMACLGYLTAARVFESQRRLIVLDTEMDSARTIQTSLLPVKAPESARLKIAAQYEPMRSVAGDFYDFVELGDERLAIIVADVSGHGVGAALVASMLKTAIELNRELAGQPAALLEKLNAVFARQSTGKYLTAVCVVVDAQSGRLSYAGAGHPPLLMKRAGSKKCEALEENGLPLGLFATATYKQAESGFAPGDRVLIYTDGIIEAANVADEQFGQERAMASLLESAQRSVEDATAHLMKQSRGWESHLEEQSDDLTVVLVEHARSEIATRQSPVASRQ